MVESMLVAVGVGIGAERRSRRDAGVVIVAEQDISSQR